MKLIRQPALLLLWAMAIGGPSISAAAPADAFRARIETEDTIVELGALADRPALLTLKSAGGDWNWAAAAAPFGLIDRAWTRDGKELPLRWSFTGGDTATSGVATIATLRFRCDKPALELESRWQARPGPGPVEHAIRVVNRSREILHIPVQESLDLHLAAPAGRRLDAWWVEKGAGTPSLHGTHREILFDGYVFQHHATPYPPENGFEMIPWLSVVDETAGHGWYTGIEFSGQVRTRFLAEGDPLALHLQSGLDSTYVPFYSKLAPGSTFETPTCFIGCFKGDADDGANRLHRFVERHLRPPMSDPRYPMLVNNSWGSGMAVDETLARKMIDDAADMGIEIYHVDAGWYRSVGDWHPNPDKFPKGLAPIADYTHAKGMLFGLWVGWSQGGNPPADPHKLAVSDPAMKSWFPGDMPDDWRPWDFTGETVCLACKEAREWCLRDLRRMVVDFKLDLLEHDQRMIVETCWRDTHDHLNNPSDTAYHAALGYYWVYDQLRNEFPNLIFEDCVNGGRMVDFGVAKRVHYICVTDTYNPLSNRRAFYDASYPLPPAMVEAYVGHHPGPSVATFKAMLRSGMMGWCTIMCDTSAWTPEQHDAAKRQFELYKTRLRPLIVAANLYHVAPRPDGEGWDGIQYHDPKTGNGVLFAFRGTDPGATHTFRFKGLRPGRDYRLTFEDKTSPAQTARGADLMVKGVTVRLDEPETSELVFLEEMGR